MEGWGEKVVIIILAILYTGMVLLQNLGAMFSRKLVVALNARKRQCRRPFVRER